MWGDVNAKRLMKTTQSLFTRSPDTGRMVMKTTADTTKDITAEESEAEVRKKNPSHLYALFDLTA